MIALVANQFPFRHDERFFCLPFLQILQFLESSTMKMGRSLEPAFDLPLFMMSHPSLNFWKWRPSYKLERRLSIVFCWPV